MYTRPGDRSRRFTRFRWSILTSLIAIATFAAGGCGGDGGTDPGSRFPVTITLAGTGKGTVIGSEGGINCTNVNGAPSGTCQADINNGQLLTLAATPATGSTFTGWSGNGLTCPASAPCTITVNSAQSITATFDAGSTTQTLTVVGGGAGTGSGVIVSEPAGIDCTISGGAAAATGCAAPFAGGTPVQLVVESGNLVGFGGACTGSTCSVVMSEPRTVVATFTADPEATQLGFVVQPSAVQVGGTITPPVQVAIQDVAGQTVAGRTDAVTLRLATNPGGATLGGQTTRNAVNGIATFSDLTVNQAGSYTLAAAATGLTEETSAAFNVSNEPTALLAFASQPVNSTAGAAITPAVTVEIRDGAGAVLTTRTDDITISIQNNPGGATLGGATTATAVAGVATFSNLTLDKAGTGYTLAASATNASGTTSTAFNITAGTPVLAIRNSSADQSAPINTNVAERPSVKIVDAFNNPVAGVPVRWEVTAGGGSVVASTTDPVVRPTGPLGLSTAVSWTLGPDVGNGNNALRATVETPGVNGSPITFTASGTIPPGQGIFTGTLKRANNTGIVDNEPIASATLIFRNFDNGSELGRATSKSDGTFSSPPFAAGIPTKIDINANTFKDITYAKPSLPQNTTVSLGVLGMVTDVPGGGQTQMSLTVSLNPAPTLRVSAAAAVLMTVEIYPGYFVGESDPKEALEIERAEASEAETQFSEIQVGDWGIMTVLVTAEGYKSVSRTIVADQPGQDVDLGVIELTQ